jgi:hypothetical protein
MAEQADGLQEREMTRGVCNFCGAWSKRSCDFYDMTDQDEAFGGAPCEEMDPDDVFGPEELDPDRLREDRDERRALNKDMADD